MTGICENWISKKSINSWLGKDDYMKIKKTGILFLLVFSLILGGCSAADMTKDTQADKVYKTKTE